jgi:hypothetical protein
MAMAGQVDDVHAMARDERRQQRRERAAMQRPSMEQHERRPAARRFDVKQAGFLPTLASPIFP